MLSRWNWVMTRQNAIQLCPDTSSSGRATSIHSREYWQRHKTQNQQETWQHDMSASVTMKQQQEETKGKSTRTQDSMTRVQRKRTQQSFSHTRATSLLQKSVIDVCDMAWHHHHHHHHHESALPWHITDVVLFGLGRQRLTSLFTSQLHTCTSQHVTPFFTTRHMHIMQYMPCCSVRPSVHHTLVFIIGSQWLNASL